MNKELENRLDFELWYSNNYVLTGDDFIKKQGQYNSGIVEMMWKAWVASRETLKLDLPAPAQLEVVHFTHYTGEEYRTNEDVYYVDDIHNMLNEIGINYE